MANIERINALIELLKTEETAKRFSMNDFFHTTDDIDESPICGTAACIAGHACLLADPKATIDNFSGMVITNGNCRDGEYMARHYLDLDSRQADWLFYAGFHEMGLSGNITPAMAIKALEHIVAGKSVMADTHNHTYVALFNWDNKEIIHEQ